MEIPWPIALDDHPFNSFKNGSRPAHTLTPADHETVTLSPEEVARLCFQNPLYYRDLILKHVVIPPLNRYEGGDHFYIWLNKNCPVGCTFCFYKSPKAGENTQITPEGIERLIQMSHDTKIDNFYISGGGDPMTSKASVNRLVRGLNVKSLDVYSSAFWAASPESAERIIMELYESAKANPNKPVFTYRLSLDRHHFERLSKGKGFSYAHNALDQFRRINDPNFKFLIRTVVGDDTVQNFLRGLNPVSCVDHGNDDEKHTIVTLPDGYSFKIKYLLEYESDTQFDFGTDEGKDVAYKNFATFHEFTTRWRHGNNALSYHPDGKSKGFYFVMHYDGTINILNASAPDIESSIYKDDHQAILNRNFNDILTLGIIEKGTLHVADIVSEVNPLAMIRANGIGIRDFYTRVLLEEDHTRLYASVRYVQEFIQEGRITRDQMASWPPELLALASLSPEQLKECYHLSGFSIIQQYLRWPDVTAKSLVNLYNLIALGQYFPLTTGNVMHAVMHSGIKEEIKKAFFHKILYGDDEIGPYISMTDEALNAEEDRLEALADETIAKGTDVSAIADAYSSTVLAGFDRLFDSPQSTRDRLISCLMEDWTD
ncbi:MAG: hypothetical protein US89_C0005G0028 [Candidatus Peregrinibacteria bacterium GW2011_GWF2_38_29]|nr:MAG: hypothetical protein US89_C0005G0028 [Candidatus Peregrinibacteria bacterium GW2011_GWF2_38_29]HBB02616.1 hypothetical protein [Candidatus Peregrinibacteria bacterium]